MKIGCAFAINRQHFWDLGAYDSDLIIWQGEQLEISFKAHLCGQGMLEIPCSRVAHSYRNKNDYKRIDENGEDFVARNFKRIVEVWFDEYKDIVYQRSPARYQDVDAGDLTRPKTIRRGLHCKPFRYFLEFVAPDMLERYPIESPGVFASGVIQSKANSKLCIDAPRTNRNHVVLDDCENNHVSPTPKQFFTLSWHRNIMHSKYDICLTNGDTLVDCHYTGGNQLWQFDINTSQIINPRTGNKRCLTADIENRTVSLQSCIADDLNQQWNWGEKNLTALSNWDTFGINLTKLNFI